MGSYMQNIRIICPSPNLLTAFNVARCVDTVLSGLSCLKYGRTTIQSFEMCQLSFDETWSGFRSSKCLLVDTVSSFLESQIYLKIFSMHNAFLTPPFAFRIMKSLIKSRSVRTMEVVDILNYYSLEVSTRVIGVQLRSVCKKCWKLQEIKLNYSYLSAANLVDVCENLDDSLKRLIIYVTVFDYSRGWNIITADSWKLACQACPRLKVSFHLEGWPRDATALLVPNMPLVELSSRGGQCRYSVLTFGEKTSLLLDHLARWFSETLLSATFVAETLLFSPPEKDAIIHFLLRCPNVRSLSFSNGLMRPEFISEVKTELSDKLNKDFDVMKMV